jgi:gamma-glutamyltranspeptidase/glutathione hydrolase
MDVSRRDAARLLAATAMATSALPSFAAAGDVRKAVDLSPSTWPAGDYERYLKAQAFDRTAAGSAIGRNGAVTVSYNGLAARAGLEALKRGGNAIDAALTTALMQVALTAGAPVSFFGIMSLVYYDANSGRVHTMNAEWNTVLNERDPMGIPGGIDFSSEDALRGSVTSGRTALVGGFMKGVEAASRRFGKLSFASLFGPAIHVADAGMPVSKFLAREFQFRKADLARLPETRRNLLKPDGSAYVAGELFRQPALAETLRRVAADGADYMYRGPWGQKLVKSVQAEGGKMTLEDLKRYDVIWGDPLVAPLANGWSVQTTAWPNSGGIALIEGQNLAQASGLVDMPHWTADPEALRIALTICNQSELSEMSPADVAKVFPGLDMSPAARVTPAHAKEMWARIQAGQGLRKWVMKGPRHSDDVVAVDAEGNIAAITHSINAVTWGKTAINIDGVSIGDPGSFSQAVIAATGPGKRLPAITETGILFRGGQPAIGFASMGSGLHYRTFQCLQNVTIHGMSVEQAINTADFFVPGVDPKTGDLTIHVPLGRFDRGVLDGTGIAWAEKSLSEARMGGEGKWVAISRNAELGFLHAASHNRSNSDAVAF